MPEPPEHLLVPRRFKAFVALEDLADERGWELIESTGESDWLVSWQAGPETFVRWREDTQTGTEYATVDGPHRAQVEAAIRAEVELLTPETYAAAFEGETTPMARGHMLLAIVTAARVERSEQALSVLTAGLRDEDPYVRRYAIFAAEILDHPQLWSVVDELRGTDPEPVVRRTAETVTARWVPAP